jgi:histidinol-phosphate/aromatic aminotransferase/cobyric acid decarboxylase-like protein
MAKKSQVPRASKAGPKAVPRLGPFPSKLGREELWELIDLWELSPGNKEKIKKILANDSHVEGPHLFRYYNPKPSRVAAAEDAMRELIGTKYCLAVNSCTSALIASYRALGIGMGDEVIVPAYTFFASAAGVAAANGIPVIAEVDDSLTLDPAAAERAITRRTRAIASGTAGCPARAIRRTARSTWWS